MVELFNVVSTSTICPGNPDLHFLELAKSRGGSFMSCSGEVKAIVEGNIPTISPTGFVLSSTIPNVNCSMLICGGKCTYCTAYRSQLRALYSRFMHKSSEIDKRTNDWYLSLSEATNKIKTLRKKCITLDDKVKGLQKKVEKLTDTFTIDVDCSLHTDILSIMNENDRNVKDEFPEGTFRRLFWEQQLKAARCTDARQMCWHPTMIKWCLNLKLLSSSAYNSLRTSGFIKLPSERTLLDYTHFFTSKTGFQTEVETMLIHEAKLSTLTELEQHIVILFDELKIKEGLVYKQNTENIIGFVELGGINDILSKLEEVDESGSTQHPAIAKHILCIMVRGIFIDLRFPFAHFPTKELTGECLYNIMYEAIERLETIGFKVIALTGDGASPNRNFFKLHSVKSKELTFKYRNPYAKEERYIYFISDVPHLMKTTRNCWSHSFWNGNKRTLWVRSCMHVRIYT